MGVVFRPRVKLGVRLIYCWLGRNEDQQDTVTVTSAQPLQQSAASKSI